ncbi:hypothetical protein IEQ34_011027 [Dendrobium chrysotoxum]|uniref:DUF4408 domain-containing protein n=1 Tax=Dendrobium chrysotoxum TaxID=161865 RepID=A0AAV7GF33_DENCH|nr:hypothetical protein IEQ34_011027 [Dendrobium chrysotoxum]
MGIPPMNAMMDLLRIRGKLAALVGGIFFAGTLSWFVVPCVFSLLASNIPRLWNSVCSSTAPPYLFFIAVNFIILTIWKLSENRALHTERLPEEESPFKPDIISVRSRDLTSPEDFGKTPSIPAGNGMLTDSATEETSPAPASESSCITKVSTEKSTASSSSSIDLLLSEAALTAIGAEGKEKTAVDDRDGTDSLDATWNAITRKSGRWERSPPISATADSRQPAFSSVGGSGEGLQCVFGGQRRDESAFSLNFADENLHLKAYLDIMTYCRLPLNKMHTELVR